MRYSDGNIWRKEQRGCGAEEQMKEQLKQLCGEEPFIAEVDIVGT